MADFKAKNINEQGIVLEKVVKKASNEFEKDGKVIPAKPERYLLTIASGDKIMDDLGIESVVALTYSVDIETYNAVEYLQEVTVTYSLSSYGYKAISVGV